LANPDPMERGLPSNPYAERMVLGSCLVGSGAASTEALMRLESDDFTTEQHRELYRCFRSLREKGIPIDHVITYEWFAARGRADVVGGLAGIMEIEEGLPELLNLESYVDILKRLSGHRKVIYLAQEATERAFLQAGPPAEIAAHFAKGLGIIANENEENRALSMAEFVDSYKGGFDALMTPHLSAPGIPTGFPRFDELTDGLHEDEILTLGAYAAAGKTSLGMTWCRHIAEYQGLPVAVFSQEMSRRSLFYRMICDEAKVAFQRFRRGAYNAEEADRLKIASSNVYSLPIYVDERSGLTPSDYALRLKTLRDKHGIRVAMIDYAQLMQPSNKRLSGAEKMGTVCTGLQEAVKQTHIPLILLSQLNREQAKAKRKPETYDLRETGVLEAISDIVAMIWREETTNRDKSNLKGQATLLIRKARNTEMKEIGMRFIGWRMRFEELTEEEEDAQV
jgi:replicative DNA helicase